MYGVSTTLLADHFGGVPGFYHGVASGDPLPTSVILWTRYTPARGTDVVDIELRVAEVDETMPLNDLLDTEKNKENLRIEELTIDNSTDFVLKIDLAGLQAGSQFVYAFVEGDSVSPVGQTQTAPDPNAQVTEGMYYAVFSCATYTQGFFHAYDIASTMKDIDLYVHVGDWIYEYGAYSKYASNSEERDAQLRPQWETVSLQDYRQRYAQYAEDEAVQNLRRRAPLFTVWDDHEFADNAYGKGTDPSNSGAANHQEECPVDWAASVEEKNKEKCDFDEGSIVDRFNAAARAYLEWMPVRSGPGSMGILDANLGSLTRVLEWGNLATLIAFDTRISERSREPTLSGVFSEFAAVAFKHVNVSEYSEPGNPVKEEIDQVAAGVKAKMYDPEFTMVGADTVDLIEEAIASSRQKGNPWQIILSPTLFGPNVCPNPATIWEYAPPGKQAAVKSHIDSLLEKRSNGLFLRIAAAMSVTNTPWNRDDWNGFAWQRKQILNVFQEHANNAIVLSGDLHDSWLWILFEGGNATGRPVAVNVGGPGVTAPGFGRTFLTALGGFVEDEISELVDDEVLQLVKDGWEAPVGEGKVGTDSSFDMVEKGFEGANPGLIHAEVRHEGFVAIRVSPEEHIAQYIHVGEGNSLSNYTEARRDNGGGLTAGFFCSGKFTTKASEPGNIDKAVACDAIEFEMNHRPAEWNIPVPVGRRGYASSSAGIGGALGEKQPYIHLFAMIAFIGIALLIH